MVQYLNQELVVSGKIDFENAEQQYQAGLAIIKKQTSFPLIVDLKQLEHGNTLSLGCFSAMATSNSTKVWITF